MQLRKIWVGPALALSVLGVATGFAYANHLTLVPQVATAAAVVAPQTLQVDNIMAQQVSAHTIYANHITADQVQGAIHQIAGLDTLYGHGRINAPDVSAAVIYADTINANTVTADTVYVRDLTIK
jgi:hypothetical protein